MNNDLQKLKGLFFAFVSISSLVNAQDTTYMTIQAAEKRFLERNTRLLAERYNIDISRAQVIQARLYNNPSISFTGNIYNPEQQKFFDISNKTGEYGMSAQ